MASLTCLRDEDFVIVVGWLDGERVIHAECAAEDERATATIVAEMTKGADEQHAAMADWARRDIPLSGTGLAVAARTAA